jgi:WD40 repeat protein
MTIRVWDLNTNKLINTYNANYAYIYDIAVLPTGLLASWDNYQRIHTWDMQTNNILNTMTTSGYGYSTRFTSTFGPNGALVMLVYYSQIQFYDPLNMTLIKTVINNHTNFFCMEILQPSGYLVAAYQYLDIYNTTYDLIFSYLINGFIHSLRLLPDNLTLVCGLLNGSLVLFNSNTFSFGSLYTAHSSYGFGFITLTPDLVYLVSGGRDSKLVFWKWSSMYLTQLKVFSVPWQLYSGLFIDSSYAGKIFI